MISTHIASLDDFYQNSFICHPYGGVRLTKNGCLARRRLAKRGRQFNSMKGLCAGGEVSRCKTCEIGEKLERGEGDGGSGYNSRLK